jgi:hypothetical protein
LKEACFRARYEARWHWFQNRSSRRRFHRGVSYLNDAQRRVVRDLLACGIAFVQWDDLGVDASEWKRLAALADSLAQSTQVVRAISEYSDVSSRTTTPNDAYLVKLYPEKPTLESSNPLLTVGVAPPVLDTVNTYLDLWSKLIYTDIWHSIPVDVGRRIGSQRWHRDPEDRRMIKVYSYFRDVGEGAGPLEYLPGSCVTGTGQYRQLWPWKPRGGRYPGDREVEQTIPRSAFSLSVGTSGTFIFCDTNGLHRGGIATTGVRLVATWTFVTPASVPILSPRRFVVDPTARPSERLSPAATFALS